MGNVIVPFDIEIGLNNLANACDLSSLDIREKLVSEKPSQLFHEGKTTASELFTSVKSSLNLRMNYDEFVDAWKSIFSLEPILSEDLIKRLGKKYRLIIPSDTNQLHYDFIESTFPILRYFDEYVLSHEVGTVKPLPKMYKKTVEKAKCLAEECLYTDDRLENVEGAKMFGINAVQFISKEQLENDLVNLGIIKK